MCTEEAFARDLIEACKLKDPKQFSEYKFESLTVSEREWILGLGEFMVNHGWRK